MDTWKLLFLFCFMKLSLIQKRTLSSNWFFLKSEVKLNYLALFCVKRAKASSPLVTAHLATDPCSAAGPVGGSEAVHCCWGAAAELPQGASLARRPSLVTRTRVGPL